MGLVQGGGQGPGLLLAAAGLEKGALALPGAADQCHRVEGDRGGQHPLLEAAGPDKAGDHREEGRGDEADRHAGIGGAVHHGAGGDAADHHEEEGRLGCREAVAEHGHGRPDHARAPGQQAHGVEPAADGGGFAPLQQHRAGREAAKQAAQQVDRDAGPEPGEASLSVAAVVRHRQVGEAEQHRDGKRDEHAAPDGPELVEADQPFQGCLAGLWRKVVIDGSWGHRTAGRSCPELSRVQIKIS
ncbi:hypothetical protein ROMU108268_19985 [Roseomonas mucosa]